MTGKHKELKEDEEVTVEMIVEVMAQEFPEFVLSVAEEKISSEFCRRT